MHAVWNVTHHRWSERCRSIYLCLRVRNNTPLLWMLWSRVPECSAIQVNDTDTHTTHTRWTGGIIDRTRAGRLPSPSTSSSSTCCVSQMPTGLRVLWVSGCRCLWDVFWTLSHLQKTIKTRVANILRVDACHHRIMYWTLAYFMVFSAYPLAPRYGLKAQLAGIHEKWQDFFSGRVRIWYLLLIFSHIWHTYDDTGRRKK